MLVLDSADSNSIPLKAVQAAKEEASYCCINGFKDSVIMKSILEQRDGGSLAQAGDAVLAVVEGFGKDRPTTEACICRESSHCRERRDSRRITSCLYLPDLVLIP